MSKKRKTLCAQARDIVISVQRYFELEAENGGPLLSVGQINLRVADALGIGKRTVCRIKKEKYGPSGMEDNELRTPKLNGKRRCTKTDINVLDMEAIRKHIIGHHDRGEYPTLNQLVTSLEEAKLFSGSGISLSRALRKAGINIIKPRQRKSRIQVTMVDIDRIVDRNQTTTCGCEGINLTESDCSSESENSTQCNKSAIDYSEDRNTEGEHQLKEDTTKKTENETEIKKGEGKHNYDSELKQVEHVEIKIEPIDDEYSE